MSAPAVSIVIPTRDRWPFLRHAIDAGLAQEEVEVEVIVVDDGSEDETPARLGEIGDRRLRRLRNERPLGVAAARNRGIDTARGEWIAPLDDDDLWSPRKLGVQLKAAASQDADWAYCAAIVVDEQRRPTRMSIQPTDPERIATELLKRNAVPAGSSNVIAKADLLRRVGCFDERLAQLADWELWVRLAAQAPAAASYEVLVAYMEHPGNMLLRGSEALMDELDYIAEKHRDKSLATGTQFDRLAMCRWIAWSERRAGLRMRAVQTYLRGAAVHRSPGNVVRAIAAALGEGAMRGPSSPHGMPLSVPEWLARYS
jgi:glycosyltransferase involved in cell wall biosynthesis